MNSILKYALIGGGVVATTATAGAIAVGVIITSPLRDSEVKSNLNYLFRYCVSHILFKKTMTSKENMQFRVRCGWFALLNLCRTIYLACSERWQTMLYNRRSSHLPESQKRKAYVQLIITRAQVTASLLSSSMYFFACVNKEPPKTSHLFLDDTTKLFAGAVASRYTQVFLNSTPSKTVAFYLSYKYKLD